jgi:hypothetical protein
VAFELGGELQPGAEYAVTVAPGIVDHEGRPAVEPERTAGFSVETEPDLREPVIGQLVPLVSDGCVVVRWVTTEPADARLGVQFNGVAAEAYDPTPLVAHELGVRLPAGEGEAQVIAQSSDLAGLTTAVSARVPISRTPRLVITGLLSNPRGPEPAQEWVELRNLEDSTVDLRGFALQSGRGARSVLPGSLLGPGVSGLVVSQRYDPFQGDDVPPAPEAVVVRLAEGRIAGGLANTGESLVLVDAQGTVVSRYGGYVNASASTNQGRSIVRVDPTGCDVRANFALSTNTATPGGGP